MIRRITLLLIAISVASSVAVAGSLSDDLSREWKDKTVIVRALPVNNRVRFNQQGELIGTVRRGSWTADGLVEINKVSVTHDSIQFKGKRVLVMPDRGGGAKELWFRQTRSKQDFEVQLQIDPSWQDVSAVQPLLNKVFTRNASDLAGLTADYWQAWFKRARYEGDGWVVNLPPNQPAAGQSQNSNSAHLRVTNRHGSSR